MDLIVISSPTGIADECRIINSLFQLGLLRFHIRKPDDDENQLRKCIEGINPQYYNRLSLHQHHQLAGEYGIKGLHYTEKARTASKLKEYKKLAEQGYVLSTSVHDIAVLSSLEFFDYAFYGPVFDSISKPSYRSRIKADFRLNKETTKLKVIALGGIDESRLATLLRMNFDGAAVLGSIWKDPLVASNTFSRLKEQWLLNTRQ